MIILVIALYILVPILLLIVVPICIDIWMIKIGVYPGLVLYSIGMKILAFLALIVLIIKA